MGRSASREVVEILERLERLVAVALVRGMGDAKQREKIALLNLAGFSNIEVADLLETTSAVVSQELYAIRKKPRAGAGKQTAAKKSRR